MQTLPTNAHPAKRWGPCTLCKRWVTKGKDRTGASIVVEACVKGKGDVTLTDPLFDGDPLLVLHVRAGSYRTHHCIERAHSAVAFEGKRAPSKLENISYRTSGPKPGGRK